MNIILSLSVLVIIRIQNVVPTEAVQESEVIPPKKRLNEESDGSNTRFKRSLPGQSDIEEDSNLLLKQWLVDAGILLEREIQNSQVSASENTEGVSRDNVDVNTKSESMIESPPKYSPPKLMGPPKRGPPKLTEHGSQETSRGLPKQQILLEASSQSVNAPPKFAEPRSESESDMTSYDRRAELLLQLFGLLLHKDRNRIARAYRVLNIDSDDVELPWERECSRGLQICNGYYPDCCGGYTCLRSMDDWDRRYGVRRCWPGEFNTSENDSE